MALLPLATLPKKGQPPPPPAEEDKPPPKKRGKHKEAEEEEEEAEDRVRIKTPGLHYNIEIHLPATKDVEVYNAIFKSLREHLIGK
jgi:hypothetical protein